MGDLISRNALLEHMENWIFQERPVGICEPESDVYKTIKEAINLVKEQPTAYDADAVAIAIAMEKQTPYKIIYKNGFGHCKCGSEFEREGYEGEEYCPECGQKVWVGGYNGTENKVVSFGEARKPEEN